MGKEVSSKSIFRRGWAANRKTTRIEDRAYSLLGIFGISMPMLYGEGYKAFIRLQEELIRNSTDHSIFAWERKTQSQLHDDMLLATNPDEFFPRGRRMIYWLGNIADDSFHLSNRGIEFECISLQAKKIFDKPASPTNPAWIILNCRDENDAGALALQVVQQDQHTASVDPSLLMKNKAYWIPSQPGVDRLCVWRSNIPTGQRLTLLRKHLASTWSTTLTPRFRIALEPSLWQSFTFVNGWPARLWQDGLDTMSLPRQSTYPELVTASVSIRCKGYSSGSFLHVAFSFSPNSAHREPRIALSRSTQEDARNKLSDMDVPDTKYTESRDEDLDSIEPELLDYEPYQYPYPPVEYENPFEDATTRMPIRAISYVRLEDSSDDDHMVFSARLMEVKGNPEHRTYIIETLWAVSAFDLDAKEKLQRMLRLEERKSYRRGQYKAIRDLGC